MALGPRRWQKNRQLLIFVGIAVGAIVLLLTLTLTVSIFGWDWTGFNDHIGPQLKQNQQYRPGKTLWDWMNLFIIPVVLTVIALLFNRAERRNEQKIATDSQQEATLQSYLDRMSELLLDKDKNLRKSELGAEVRNIARARTLTALSRLDGDRRGSLLQFLCETNLISIIDLSEAELSEANLYGARLGGARLSRAELSKAKLFWADLSGANLSEASLRRARLAGANLRKANLYGANLCEASLYGADLCEANLYEADLSGANLSGTNLSGANLSRAKVTPEQLDQAKARNNTIQ